LHSHHETYLTVNHFDNSIVANTI